jgi:TRAP-type C4-dicarboxylate transport system substrate-binding protein
VQKHLTISNHGYLGYAVIVNSSFWNRLPSDIQEKIMEAMEETTTWNYQMAAAMNEQQLQLIKMMNAMQVYELTPEEKLAWQQAFQPVYAIHTRSIGEELVTKIKQQRER